MRTDKEIKESLIVKTQGRGKHRHSTTRCPFCTGEESSWDEQASELLVRQKMMYHIRQAHPGEIKEEG